jgi:hypothetical protein
MNFKEKISKIISRVITCKNCTIIALIFLRLGVRERCTSGVESLFFAKNSKKITILALDSDRYRGDLDRLIQCKDIRILSIKQSWQSLFIQSFYSDDLGPMPPRDIVNSKKGDSINLQFSRCNNFIINVLEKLMFFVHIDCVTTVNYRYLYDYNFTLSFEKLGIPHIMLYRECLLAHSRSKVGVTVRHKQMGRFHGSKIIVHNNICRDLFIESGYCNNSQVSVCGALRMDKFINSLSSEKFSNNKTFTLFYFPYTATLFGQNGGNIIQDNSFDYAYKIWDGRKELFRKLHESILHMAKNNPNINFVIKPKANLTKGDSWDFYKEILHNSGINIKDINNYKIEPYTDASQLIIKSDVVCALQSSVVVESALAGKRIIFPLFENFSQSKNFQDFNWKDVLHLFDCAKNVSEFEHLVLNSILNPKLLSEEEKIERQHLFKKYFYTLDSNALECYTDVIRSVVDIRSKE